VEFTPANSLGDLLPLHRDALEQEAKEGGSALQLLADPFAKVFEVSIPLAAQCDRGC
jgi:hypothetical protein